MKWAKVYKPPSRFTENDLITYGMKSKQVDKWRPSQRLLAPTRGRRVPAPAIPTTIVFRERVRLMHSAIVVAIVLAAINATLNSRFVNLDDSLYLGNNWVAHGLTFGGALFAFTTVSTLYWHPLAWLSHELDVELFGMNPAGHHFTSALLHSISAGLLFLILRRLGAGKWTSTAGVLFGALHPLRVESFAWVAERKDVLCALFFLATILAYLRYVAQPSPARYAGWTCLAALAFMSKPTAVCLAPILLLLDYWPLRRTSGIGSLLKEKLPIIGMTASVMFLTVYGQKTSGSMSHLANVGLFTRLQNVPISYVRYIGKMLWPLNLSLLLRVRQTPGCDPGNNMLTDPNLHDHRRGAPAQPPTLASRWLALVPRSAAPKHWSVAGRPSIHRGPVHTSSHDRYRHRDRL